jgi:hypothetical protein
MHQPTARLSPEQLFHQDRATSSLIGHVPLFSLALRSLLERQRRTRRRNDKLGEISRDLEKAERVRTDLRDTDDVQTKTETLANAGIKIRTAQRYEELTGGKEKQAQVAADIVRMIARSQKSKLSAPRVGRKVEHGKRPASQWGT